MQITIKPSLLRHVAGSVVDQLLLHDFSPNEIRQAKLPKKSELIDELLANEKFLKGVNRYLSMYINDVYVLDDAFLDGSDPDIVLGKYVRKVERTTKKMDKLIEQKKLTQP